MRPMDWILTQFSIYGAVDRIRLVPCELVCHHFVMKVYWNLGACKVAFFLALS